MKISEFAETPPCEIESDREFRPYWGRKLSVNGDEMLLWEAESLWVHILYDVQPILGPGFLVSIMEPESQASIQCDSKILFGIIFYPILGFSDAKYKGPAWK